MTNQPKPTFIINSEMKEAIDLVLNTNTNVYLTGRAGTGCLQEEYNNRSPDRSCSDKCRRCNPAFSLEIALLTLQTGFRQRQNPPCIRLIQIK